MMNKYDKADAHRELLKHWLQIIRSSIERQERENIEMLEVAKNEQSGERIFVPPNIQIPPVSSDMRNLLINGLEAALQEKPDPFEIELPKKGVSPNKSRGELIEIVAEILREVEPDGGRGVTAAIQKAATDHGVSYGSLRAAYYDKNINGWAKVSNETRVKCRKD